MKDNLRDIAQIIWIVIMAVAIISLLVWAIEKISQGNGAALLPIAGAIFITTSWLHFRQEVKTETEDNMIEIVQHHETYRLRQEVSELTATNTRLTKQLAATQESLAATTDNAIINKHLATTLFAGNLRRFANIQN